MGPCVAFVPLWSLAAGKKGAIAALTGCTAHNVWLQAVDLCRSVMALAIITEG
jgi:hypothetical protein